MRSLVTEEGGKVNERTGWLTLTESVFGSGKAWFSRVLWACRSELLRTVAVALEARAPRSQRTDWNSEVRVFSVASPARIGGRSVRKPGRMVHLA
jgi:hypothetical protein